MSPHEQVSYQLEFRLQDASFYDAFSQCPEDMEAEREELTDEDPLSEAEPLESSRSVGAWKRVHRPTVCGQMAP